MSEKNQKTINFLKKNAYYLVFILCLTVLAVITIALVVAGEDNSNPVGGNNPIENNGGNINDNNKPENENQNNQETPPADNSGEENQEKPSDKPTVEIVVFDLPVNGTIIKEYVGAGVIYNQTLGLYSGHKAIDFGAEEGAQVFACYKGVVEDILTDKLEGTSVIINHGNGLKTVYNSIEVEETLQVGDSVDKGSLLGFVSTNNRKEYKDGAHLHFEVLENDQKIDPYKYLLAEEK